MPWNPNRLLLPLAILRCLLRLAMRLVVLLLLPVLLAPRAVWACCQEVHSILQLEVEVELHRLRGPCRPQEPIRPRLGAGPLSLRRSCN